eukprot:9871565-Lingulodinium_polyedra.AAC.1
MIGPPNEAVTITRLRWFLHASVASAVRGIVVLMVLGGGGGHGGAPGATARPPPARGPRMENSYSFRHWARGIAMW